ncbi:hypothetical protein GCM10023166_27810 [Paeniglutamicibacter cryotolerans]
MLKAMANPLRRQILAILGAVESARATDLAQRLDVPANKLSFHLRVLAAAGIIAEAPELARDRRDRVWQTVPGGLRIGSPDAPAPADDRLALLAYLDQEGRDQHRRLDAVLGAAAAYAKVPETDPRALLNTTALLLDEAELEELGDRIIEVIRSMKRKHAVPVAESGERKLWHFTMFMAREDLPGLEASGDGPGTSPGGRDPGRPETG